MEPVTHILTGACLARTGLNRRAAYATLTMAVAAEFPDIDTLWSLRGPVEGFQHHRGITHTFLGVPFEAALLVAAVYGLHRWRLRRAKSNGKPLTAAPVRWVTLYFLALLALLSHLLLDYTNNYGLRPFYPFNPHWYAASIVFIFDPLIFLLLLSAFLAPWIFGLVGSEVGARKQPFRGRGWAVAALLGVAACWGFREIQHEHAVQMELAQNVAAPVAPTADPDADTAPVYLSAQRALASPDPISPFRWSGVVDYGPVYQLTELNTRTSTLTPADNFVSKPDRSAALLAAEASPLGRAYIDWSPMPFVRAAQPDGKGNIAVTFQDPRFLGGFLAQMSESTGRSALTGVVTLDAQGNVIGESMDGRAEHGLSVR
jgi:inner membrane protein